MHVIFQQLQLQWGKKSLAGVLTGLWMQTNKFSDFNSPPSPFTVRAAAHKMYSTGRWGERGFLGGSLKGCGNLVQLNLEMLSLVLNRK